MLPEFLGAPSARAGTGRDSSPACTSCRRCCKDVTGMQGVSLTPMAGAQGEFAGVAMIRAYHGRAATWRAPRSSCRRPRTAPIPRRRPCAAAPCSEIPVDARRRRRHRRAARGRRPADRRHHADEPVDARRVRAEHRGDRAHRPRGRRAAVLRRRQPQRHPRQGAAGRHGLRRHPHESAQDVLDAPRRRRAGRGRGGRRRAAAAVPADSDRRPATATRYRWLDERDLPQSIGRLSAFMGNAGVLLRAYIYMRMLGREGMKRVGEFATLNANYLLARLQQAGFEAAYPQRRASHEFIITLKREARERGHGDGCRQAPAGLRLSCADDVFPAAGAGVPADRADRDRERRRRSMLSSSAMSAIRAKRRGAGTAEGAPYTLPVRRLDDVRAARNSTWPGNAPAASRRPGRSAAEAALFCLRPHGWFRTEYRR